MFVFTSQFCHWVNVTYTLTPDVPSQACFCSRGKLHRLHRFSSVSRSQHHADVADWVKRTLSSKGRMLRPGIFTLVTFSVLWTFHDTSLWNMHENSCISGKGTFFLHCPPLIHFDEGRIVLVRGICEWLVLFWRGCEGYKDGKGII